LQAQQQSLQRLLEQFGGHLPGAPAPGQAMEAAALAHASQQ